MKAILKSLSLFILILFSQSFAQSSETFEARLLEDFEDFGDWQTVASQNVQISLSSAQGTSGRCIRIDYNFTGGTGYCGIEKTIDLDLPENCRFTFYIRGESPNNNLEFKLIDRSGDNVWWKNQRDFEFPSAWQKQTIKKRQIEFAWGPTEDRSLRHAYKLQFIIASLTGGKGSVWLDGLTFQVMPKPSGQPAKPAAEIIPGAASETLTGYLFDGNAESRLMLPEKTKDMIIDLGNSREFGGLTLAWDKSDYADRYSVYLSQDKKHWEKAYTVKRSFPGRRYLAIKDAEARYVKLQFEKSSRGKGYSLGEVVVNDPAFSENPENLFISVAKDFKRGEFPRYLLQEASFWNVIGVNGDMKEAMINTDGMIETDKASYSLEPFIYQDNKLLTWNDSKNQAGLLNQYLPMPYVIRNYENLSLTISAFASGEQGRSSLYCTYKVKNTGSTPSRLNLFIAIRPFQVNPYYQFLNKKGGIAKIRNISQSGRNEVSVDGRKLITVTKPEAFGAADFDRGDIVEYLSSGVLPEETSVSDENGFASAALKYTLTLGPGEEKEVCLVSQFYPSSPNPGEMRGAECFEHQKDETEKYWENRLRAIDIRVPREKQKIINTLKSNLAYILINRDSAGIQPGSRSYERSWIRDGAMTSSALLKFGLHREVREFIEWYSKYLFSNGKVPCVVDTRGADPVDENDSNGEFIFLIAEYFRFTQDTQLVRNTYDKIQQAAKYLDHLSSLRKTDKYKNGNDSLKALYGLLPESISHEGYSAKPMHSYWDDFWALRGLKDAVFLSQIVSNAADEKYFTTLRDEFGHNLYASIERSIKNHSIDYIPGAAELGDFDATSTAIAIYPSGELKNLPEPYARNTFDRYFKYFEDRRDNRMKWENYTPYEVRVIGAFIYLNQPERARALLDFFFTDQFPKEWNHWAEVVWSDTSRPGFIGDMPHTWVGSDYISSVRAMFLYEDEYDSTLVIAPGIDRSWFSRKDTVAVRGFATYYGTIDYSITGDDEGLTYTIGDRKDLNDLRMKNPRFRIKKHEEIKSAVINGIEQQAEGDIIITQYPAVVRLIYR